MSRSTHCYVLFVFLSLANSSPHSLNLTQVNDWADDISNKIVGVWENISCHQHLRKAYEESLKKVAIVDKKQLLIEIAEEMEQYFSKKIDSLRRVKTKAEMTYAQRKDATVTAEDVKYVNMIDIENNASKIPVSLHFDERFKRRVNTSYSGIQIPTNIYHEGPEVLKTINWTSELDEVFIDNFMNRDNTLKWQYFGSRDAVFRTYPAKLWTNAYYSARRRPWYTQGAASPKNMVILLDKSGSMVGKTAIISRLAVSSLIDTLTENDFFNVLYFNTDVRSLACNKTLVQATKTNREWFKSKLTTSGNSNVARWEKALGEAFKILETASGAQCQNMIMIFTDGSEHKYEDVFEQYNKDKKVRVFTYLLGTPSPAHSSEELKWMACSNKGYFYVVPTVGAVRDFIEDYVSVLSRPMANETLIRPLWTGPYRDASGLGIMVTGTLPVFYEETFLGVCGTDVTISELSNFVHQSYIGAGGYAFIINNNGHIVKHPNLRATYGYVKSAGVVDLSQAEFVPENQKDSLLDLRKEMLFIAEEKTGEKSFTAFSFTEYERYLRITLVERTYIFSKLRDTPFSLGITSPKFGYDVQDYQSFIVENESNETDEFVLLENFKHCNSTNLPLKTTTRHLRSLLQQGDCNANLLLDLNITQNIWSTNASRSNITAAFVKTNWGLVKISNSNETNVMEEPMFQRINDLKDINSIILSVPYNDGESDDFFSNLLVYKGIGINVSGMSITPAVSGFQIDEEYFLKDYLRNISSQDNYHVYLLDENAFVVSSSLTDERASGQFFGSVEWELMLELEKGREPLYTRFTLRNKQGECLETPTGSSSSASNYPFYSALTSSFSSWIKSILACLLHLNFYNLLFADAATIVTPQVQTLTNRSCVTNITAYYGNTTRWKSFKGNTTCRDCGDSEERPRQFFVAPVRKTNLVLVVVEYFPKENIFQYTKNTDDIPGKPKEKRKGCSIPKCGIKRKTVKFRSLHTYSRSLAPDEPVEMQESSCRSSLKLPRNLPKRCVLSESEEAQYSCGKAACLEPSIFFIFLHILYHIMLTV